MQKFVGAVLDGAIAERIHPDTDGQTAKRIVILGTRQHRSLIAEPPNVAKKTEDQQRASADSNADLCAGKTHCERKFIGMATSRKITAGRRERTCTAARKDHAAKRKARSRTARE
jgi:hypothetical protein